MWWTELLGSFLQRKGLSMRDLGRASGANPSTVSRLLRGVVKPQTATVRALAQLIEVPETAIKGWMLLGNSLDAEAVENVRSHIALTDGGVVALVTGAIWRLRPHWDLDALSESFGPVIFDNDPAGLYDLIEKHVGEYTLLELRGLVHRAGLVLDRLDGLEKSGEDRDLFTQDTQRFLASMGQHVLERERQLRLESKVRDIRSSLESLVRLAQQVETRVLELPNAVRLPSDVYRD